MALGHMGGTGSSLLQWHWDAPVGLRHPGGTGTPQWHWEWDTLVGLGHCWDWDTAGTRTLALGHFSSTGISWWHRDTPMGLKYNLVRLRHYRGTLSGIGTLSLV